MDNPSNKIDDRLSELAANEEAVQTDWRDHNQPLVAIAETVGAFLNERPTDLPPLGTAIDGDALKRLLTANKYNTNPMFRFEYRGLEITITETEILIVEPAPTAGD